MHCLGFKTPAKAGMLAAPALFLSSLGPVPPYFRKRLFICCTVCYSPACQTHPVGVLMQRLHEKGQELLGILLIEPGEVGLKTAHGLLEGGG